MGWATGYIKKLQAGETVQFRPRGNSMQPKIESGQLCTVEPMKEETPLHAGDVVLCKVNGREFLHIIKVVRDGRYQIGNNKGHINGWVGPKSIYGRLAKVEP